MRIVEKQSIYTGFLEREVDFPLARGLAIKKKFYDCGLEVFFKTNELDDFFRVFDGLPPMNCLIDTFVFQCDAHESGQPFIEFVDIEESPLRLSLTSENIEKNTPREFSIQFKVPSKIAKIPKEAEIQLPDNKILKINKSSTNFVWRRGRLGCVLASGIDYRIRFRAKIGSIISEWSNWLTFRLPPKRSLGRRFK